MAVDPPRCQHIALHANDLEVVRSFHSEVLGLEVANYLPEEGVLAFQLRDGFVLRYERSDHPVDTESVRFIGLELPSFEDVDQMCEQVESRGVEVLSDLRETFRTSKGPYGFVIADPAGWRFKIFKYNEDA